ncbi:MAG: hypothetical protein PHE09_03380 [Oscillospiraceae bacterium]|nr:hypothetical protein [Oscillospiraceae bacterium]
MICFADHRTKRGDGGRGVEIENTEEIFMLKIVLRLHATAGHEGIGDADGGGVSELHSDIKLIITVQKGIVNDVENIVLVVVPVFIRKLRRDTLHLFGKAVLAGHTVIALQHCAYRVIVFRLQLPQIEVSGLLPASGVRNIKHIAQAGVVSVGVYKGNAGAAAPDIAPHALVPKVVFRTGGGLRALGVNHELLVVRVLVEPRGGGQKGCPFLIAARELRCRVLCHLAVCL